MSNGVCVKYGSKKVVRLTVRRGNPVAMFILENEMLKDFRRTANSNAKLKVHETELVIREEADLDTAFKMVDITVEQIGKDIEAAKERRREARRARRARRAEDAAAETPRTIRKRIVLKRCRSRGQNRRRRGRQRRIIRDPLQCADDHSHPHTRRRGAVAPRRRSFMREYSERSALKIPFGGAGDS